MKKFLTGLLATGLIVAFTHAANIVLSPLLQGYNVLLTTNVTPGLGVTNVQFTLPNGQVVNSLTTNLYYSSTGSSTTTNLVNTNTAAPDAFKIAKLYPDALGDFNSTATLVAYFGNTNWEPQFYFATNNNGLVYLLTNSVGNYWPLATSLFPNWNYPATPLTYPTYPANTSNSVTINLYPGAGKPNASDDTPANFPKLFSTTPIWSATYVVAAGIPTCVMTNIPAVSLQQFREVYATVSSVSSAGITTSTNTILNFLGIYQPVP